MGEVSKRFLICFLLVLAVACAQKHYAKLNPTMKVIIPKDCILTDITCTQDDQGKLKSCTFNRKTGCEILKVEPPAH